VDVTEAPSVVDDLMARARAAQRGGQPEEAERLLGLLIGRHPDHAPALNMLGLTVLQRGDLSRAHDLIARATRAEPGVASLWLNLAQVQRARGDDEGEQASLTAALDRDPYLLIAHVRAAELHARRGEEAQAVAAWQAVLTLCANQPAPSPAQRQLIARAESYIAPRTQRMVDALSTGLDGARAGYSADQTHRFDAAMDHAAGRRAVYVSQSSGLHFPFLPAEEFLARAHFPWLASIEAETPAIIAEMMAVRKGDGEGFAPYVDQASGAAENIWSGLSRAPRWSAYYLWRYGVRNDAACARCPATARALAALPLADQPGRAPTAFFSVLTAGSRIPPHTGVTNTRTIVHLPLVVPPGCGFRVGGDTRSWRVGEAFVFDDTIEHEAWNDSDSDRVVLIFDVWNPHLTEAERTLLRAFCRTADATGLGATA
jgi:aspartyl/asparaginyl beta-hydroxylase (cupin superfamily)